MADIITVTALNRYVKTLLERDVVLDGLAIRGEISGFVHHFKSGHFYFSLKDSQCSVKAVMFSRDARRLAFEPQNGMRVIVRGRVSLFERDGAFQVYAEDMIPDGIGSMQLALDQLKARLAAEGLFDERHKKPIPTEPACIGVVTSATGAALQDICNILRRRWPLVRLLLAPANVQGEQAAQEIVSGIRRLDADGRADVIVVARGGGSKEDLWVFNDERIVRAAFACRTPLVSAVGHEIDYTLLDFAADLRAPTPSAAAELCVPDQVQVMQKIQILQENIQKSMQKRLDLWYNSYERMRRTLQTHSPLSVCQSKQEQLEVLRRQLSRAMHVRHTAAVQRAQAAASLCAGLDPCAVITRGYALLYHPDGSVVPSAEPLEAGARITVQRSTQKLTCLIEYAEPVSAMRVSHEKTKNV